MGRSKTISNPAAADATMQGPQHNLCSFSPAAYRTHNKGPVAAGPFATKVYRDNALVHTHNVPGGLAAKERHRLAYLPRSSSMRGRT